MTNKLAYATDVQCRNLLISLVNAIEECSCEFDPERSREKNPVWDLIEENSYIDRWDYIG